MKKTTLLILLGLVIISCHRVNTSKPKPATNDYIAHTIAFYNLENLYGLEEDPNTVSSNYTVRAEKFYTQRVYEAKQRNMAKVIADIGRDFTRTSPTIIGLAEIENFHVLNDLVNQESLRNDNYAIIHYDSPDLRGIDVGLLYKKNIFIPTNSKTYKLHIYQDIAKTKRKHTRDQLVVSGILEGEKIHLIVHHWPSRSSNPTNSITNRIKAAELNKHIIDSLLSMDSKAKIINMGDFNDEPVDHSIKKILKTKAFQKDLKEGELYNPMEVIFRKGIGSLAWRDNWSLFDQIMISAELASKNQSLSFYQAGVYNKAYLTTTTGKFKGYPFRSYSSEGWTGGYSDHFPVFIHLIKRKSRLIEQ